MRKPLLAVLALLGVVGAVWRLLTLFPPRSRKRGPLLIHPSRPRRAVIFPAASSVTEQSTFVLSTHTA